MAGKAKLDKGKRIRAAERKTRRAVHKAAVPETAVSVTFRHVDPTQALRDYAQKKLGHIARFLRRPTEAHLILTVDKYRQHGEVTVKSGRLTVAAMEETKDLYAVIDLLADKVQRQLKRTLEKGKAKKVRAPSTPEVLSAAEESEPTSGVGRA